LAADDNRLVPAFQILVDGQAADVELASSVIGIRCADDLDHAARFQIHLSDPGRKWTRTDKFKPGTEIEIKLGYVGQLGTVCKAVVQSLEVVLTPDGPARLVVAGLDKGHSFGRGTVTKTYQDVKDSDLAQQIAQRNGLTADVDDTKVVHEFVFQNNLSDYDFLLQRATLAGFRFQVDGTKLSFKKPRVSEPASAKLTWRENVGRLAVEVNTYDQVSKFSTVGWDPKQRKEMTSPGKGGDEYGKQGGQVTGAEFVKQRFGEIEAVIPAATGQQNFLEAIAKSEFNKRAGSFVTAEGRVTGDPAIRAGAVVSLEKAAKRIDGEYYVVSSEHLFFVDTGYATEFRARRYTIQKKSPQAKEAPASGVVLDKPADVPLVVHVESTKGGNVGGAGVDVTGPQTAKGKTDDEGKIRFDLPPGSYRVSAALDNFTAPAAQPVTLVEGAPKNVSVKLTPNAVTAKIDALPLFVVVRKHNCNPKRKQIKLGVTGTFTGTGTGRFTLANPAHDTVRFFTAASGGTRLVFDGKQNVFTAAQLTAGVTLYAEGAEVSSKQEDTELRLDLFVGKNKVGTPASGKATCLDVALDLFQSRTKAAGDPDPMTASGKTDVGRFVHVQDAGFHQGRALLVVREVQPPGFKGTLELKRIAGGAGASKLFDGAHENPAAGQPVTALPATFTAAQLSGSKIAGANGVALFVEGDKVSGALRDVMLQLGIQGDEDDCDRASFTVVKLTNLQAVIPASPSPRIPGPYAPHGPFTIAGTAGNDFEEDFGLNQPLVLLESSVDAANPVALSVAVAPAGVPISWSALRDVRPSPGGDDSSVVALSPHPVPHLAPTGATTAALRSDAVGSFHVRAFVNNNANAGFDRDPAAAVSFSPDPFILVNVALVRATLVNQNVTTPVGPRVAWGGGPSIGGDRPFTIGSGNDCIQLEAVVQLVSGGRGPNAGRVGMDRVFAGWINNMTADLAGFSANYVDGTTAPPTPHRAVYHFESPKIGPTFRVPPAVAVVPVAIPPNILDTGHNANRPPDGDGIAPGTGGQSACLMTSKQQLPANLAVGLSRKVQAVDSPAPMFTLVHPGFRAAIITTARAHASFRAFLCLWTSNGPAPAPSSFPVAAPGERLYVCVLEVPWRISGDFNVNVNVAAGTVTITPTGAAPATHSGPNVKHSPAVSLSTAAADVLPPPALQLAVIDATA
jgi:phage protein D